MVLLARRIAGGAVLDPRDASSDRRCVPDRPDCEASQLADCVGELGGAQPGSPGAGDSVGDEGLDEDVGAAQQGMPTQAVAAMIGVVDIGVSLRSAAVHPERPGPVFKVPGSA